MMSSNNHLSLTIFLSLFVFVALSAQDIAFVEPSSNLTHTTKQADSDAPEKKAAPTLAELGFDWSKGQHGPQFADLDEYFNTHIEYPRRAVRHGVEGRVEVMLIINAQGEVIDAQLVKKLGHGCDQAALELLRNMPDWTPASNYGIPVKGKAIVELDFRLQ